MFNWVSDGIHENKFLHTSSLPYGRHIVYTEKQFYTFLMHSNEAFYVPILDLWYSHAYIMVHIDAPINIFLILCLPYTYPGLCTLKSIALRLS
jgi:hypothetical protein